MSLQLISNADFDQSVPFVELDDVIIGKRTECLGLYDFLNEDCIPNKTLGLGSSLFSLTNDRTESKSAGSMALVTINQNGMFRPNQSINLSDKMTLSPDTKKYLYILKVKLSKNDTINALCSLGGQMLSNNNWKYGLACQYDANGVAQNLRLLLPSSDTISQTLVISDTDIVNKVFDNNPHQLAYEWDGTAGNSATVKLYCDGILLTTKTVPFSNKIIEITAKPIIGSSSPFGANLPNQVLLGRCSLWDLTDSEFTSSEIINEDLTL